MATIKPASANQIKLLRKLSKRKHRYKEKLWLAEGMRCAEQILNNNPDAVLQIFISTDFSEAPSFIPSPAKIFSLEPNLLNSLSDTETPQGILAICKMPEEIQPRHIAANRIGVILALDAIQDPGNLGTIIRTASWFNVTAILAGTGTTDPFQPKTVRSTAGATGKIPIISGKLTEMLTLFHTYQWEISLLDSDKESEPIQQVKKADKQILVFGNEGNGISHEIKNLGFPSIEIPGNKKNVESLNVAMACGISLYHFST